MATKRGIRVLSTILGSSRASLSLPIPILRPYPNLPRTLQPAQLARRYAHSIPKPPPSQPPNPESDSKPRKLLEPHYELTFTCVPCGSRSSHTISKQGYHKGSVLITCPSCRNRHIISDHLNIFGDRKITVEDLMKEKGQLVKRGTLGEDGDVEFWEDGTVTERGGAAAGKTTRAAVDGPKSLDNEEQGSTDGQTRNPSPPSAEPAMPSSSPLAGAGTRPKIDDTSSFSNDAPSTRRQYHAAASESPTRTLKLPKRLLKHPPSDCIGSANASFRGPSFGVRKEGSPTIDIASAVEHETSDSVALSQDEMQYLRSTLRAKPGYIRTEPLPSIQREPDNVISSSEEQQNKTQEHTHSELTSSRRTMISKTVPKAGMPPPFIRIVQSKAQGLEKVHIQRAKEMAELQAGGTPNHGSTLGRTPAPKLQRASMPKEDGPPLSDNNSTNSFRRVVYKSLGAFKYPNVQTAISPQTQNLRSSLEEGDGDRWATSLTEMSTWIHNAVSNLEPIITKLPVRPESGQSDMKDPEAAEAAPFTSQSADDLNYEIDPEKGNSEAQLRMVPNPAPKVGIRENPHPPEGSRVRFVLAGKKFQTIRYVEEHGPSSPAFIRPLSSPDENTTLDTDYSGLDSVGPRRHLSPSEVQESHSPEITARVLDVNCDEANSAKPSQRVSRSEHQVTADKKVAVRKAKGTWDKNDPTTLPSRLRKLVQEPKRFVYAWPHGATVPIQVQVKPVSRPTSQKSYRWGLQTRPTEKEWESVSSNIPKVEDVDLYMSPEVVKEEVAATSDPAGKPIIEAIS